MPTWKATIRFRREFEKLAPAQQAAFHAAVGLFVEGLRTGKVSPSLRLHKVTHTHLWSISWAKDGRATFEFRTGPVEGEVHVLWRRIGGHEIYG